MSATVKRILAVCAVLLLAAATVLVIYLLKTGEAEPEAQPGQHTQQVTHGETEYYTNADGSTYRIVYYKDNKLAGSVDYVTMDYDSFAIHFDADNNIIKKEKYTVNAMGKPVSESITENDTLTRLVEYTYYDDMETLSKKLTKTYEDGVETAIKEMYSEDGRQTDEYKYIDGNETEHRIFTYDENGSVTVETAVEP